MKRGDVGGKKEKKKEKGPVAFWWATQLGGTRKLEEN